MRVLGPRRSAADQVTDEWRDELETLARVLARYVDGGGHEVELCIVARSLRDERAILDPLIQRIRDHLDLTVHIVLPCPCSDHVRMVLRVEEDYRLVQEIRKTYEHLRAILSANGAHGDGSFSAALQFSTLPFFHFILAVSVCSKTDRAARFRATYVEPYHFGKKGKKGKKGCTGGRVPLFVHECGTRPKAWPGGGAQVGAPSVDECGAVDLYASHFAVLYKEATGATDVATMMGWGAPEEP